MPRELLHESSSVTLKRDGSKWRAILITPGQGSSGNYAESMLSESGPAAFPAGTKHYFKHPDAPTDQRDPRDQWGVSKEGAFHEEGTGLVSEITILPHWREVVESLAEHGQAPLSIWAAGEKDEFGNVTALLPDVKNSVDLVDYPGRPGSGLTEKLLESARAASSNTPGVTSAQEKEARIMEEEIKALKLAIESLATTVTTFIKESKEAAETQRQAEADAEAEKQEKEQAIEAYAEAEKAISDAKLLPSQAESLRAAAKRGEDVAPLIESAKKIVDEAKTVLTETNGSAHEYRLHESDSSDSDDYSVAGYGA